MVCRRFREIGFVSDAALEAGGRVHGIIPRALTGRAAERAVKKVRQPGPTDGDGKTNGDVVEGRPEENGAAGGSKEGTGERVVKGVSELFTDEVVNTMHEASTLLIPAITIAHF